MKNKALLLFTVGVAIGLWTGTSLWAQEGIMKGEKYALNLKSKTPKPLKPLIFPKVRIKIVERRLWIPYEVLNEAVSQDLRTI